MSNAPGIVIDDATEIADLVLMSASDRRRSAAYLLSVALGTPLTVLVTTANAIWPGLEIDSNDFQQLEDFPFVRASGGLLSMDDDVALAIAKQFEADDRAAFLESHRLLQIFEAGRSQSSDASDSWFGRVRLAYYLVVDDEVAAGTRFEEAFEETPDREETTSYRVWLTGVVHRQARLFRTETQVVHFFQGFGAYVAGDYREASRRFGNVVSANRDDGYTAIAMHLRAVSERKRGDASTASSAVRIGWLEESLRRSLQLELVENEIMARNSLVSEYLGEDPATALDLGLQNFDKADSQGDWWLSAVTTTSLGLARWNSIGDHALPYSPEERSALTKAESELLRALAISQSHGEVDSALICHNYLAGLYGQLRDDESAISHLKQALQLLKSAPTHYIAEKLSKTTGHIRRYFKQSPNTVAALNDLLSQLERS